MNGNLRLRVQDLSIEFGGLKAVSDFSCELYDGELVGLIGPNGAGKTTVFNMLSGIYTPSSGEIEFRGRQGIARLTKNMSPAKRNRNGIARTFQNIRLFSNLSVEDNIRIALHAGRSQNPVDVLLRLKRFRTDELRMGVQTDELLSLFNMKNKKGELAGSLPYGEQRKLEIARALASGPCLLLLDEPAAGMNPQETEDLMKIIGFIRNEFRLTILLIEHDMRLVMGICERLIVIDYGRIIATGKPEEIQKNPSVIKAYLGTEAVDDA